MTAAVEERHPAIPGVAPPVLCRNMMSGPTVIAANGKRDFEVIFAGKGDPNGEDVQAIQDELLRLPQFAAAVRKGILAIVEGEENPYVQAAMSRQTDSFRRRAERDEEEARSVLDAPAKDDILIITCMGPGPREGAECGDSFPVRASAAEAAPPLCDRHRHLAELCLKRGSGPWQMEIDGVLVPRAEGSVPARVPGQGPVPAPAEQRSAMASLLKDASGT